MDEDRQERADAVWNRACDAMAADEPPERTGDAMLMRAIAFDGEVHANGLLDRLERDGVDEAIEALRWFGLTDAAERVERISEEWRRLAASDGGVSDEAMDELDAEADRVWFEEPQDMVADQLTAALLARLGDDPTAFSPI